jgi:hypothetical protein
VKLNLLSGPDASAGTITFNPWTTVLGRRIHAGLLQHPVACAGLGILSTNEVSGFASGRGIAAQSATACQRRHGSEAEHAAQHLAATQTGGWAVGASVFHLKTLKRFTPSQPNGATSDLPQLKSSSISRFGDENEDDDEDENLRRWAGRLCPNTTLGIRNVSFRWSC